MKVRRCPHQLVLALVAFSFLFSIRSVASPRGQSYRTLYRFQGGSDGWEPFGVPAVDQDGNLYGVTNMGGAHSLGTVYRLSAPQNRSGKWTKTVLYDFPGFSGGGYPIILLIGADGNFYGVDYSQTIFELKPPKSGKGAWKYEELYTLNQGNEGSAIQGMVFDAKGNLYGATEEGGDPSCMEGGCGTVFELVRPTKNGGKWNLQVLYSFTGEPDGALPFAGVTFDGSGNLFGTTWNGGSANGGAVYRVSPPRKKGDGWSETVVHSFVDPSDGARPTGPLTFDSAGNIYGTTYSGGDLSCQGTGCGVVFELAPPNGRDGTWTYTMLYAFQGGNDGIGPEGCIVFDAKGNLYSTTIVGGVPLGGTAFRLSPPTGGRAWTETMLHEFPANKKDGYEPAGGVTWGKWGDLYGVDFVGGDCETCGTVFELKP